MITFNCPACNFSFVNRTDGRCPKCRALLTHEGEAFDPIGEETVYAWFNNQWMILDD